MTYSLEWHEVYRQPVIILLVSIITYIIYHYWLNSENLGKYISGGKAQQKAVLWQRITGGLVLFSLPSLTIVMFFNDNVFNYGLNILNIFESLKFTLIILVLLLPVLYLSSRNPKQQEVYPQIRSNYWTTGLFLKSVCCWVIYLTGYEFLFRGALLFPLADAFGSWPAIIITTSLYVLAHINKTAGETIGCIPVGIIFGMMALSTGSILGPLAAHIFIASISELFAIINNPAMSFVKK